jgi:hypothetical protein
MGVHRCQGGSGGASVGTGGGTLLFEGHRQRLLTRGALAVALAAACQWDYGWGIFGVVGNGGSSVGRRWRVFYVGALAVAGREELNNQLECGGSGSMAASTTT